MISVQDFTAKLEAALTVLAPLDPHVALAEVGVEALSALFGTVNETKTMLATVMAETEETAPDVAKQVIAFYAGKSAEWDNAGG